MLRFVLTTGKLRPPRSVGKATPPQSAGGRTAAPLQLFLHGLFLPPPLSAGSGDGGTGAAEGAAPQTAEVSRRQRHLPRRLAPGPRLPTPVAGGPDGATPKPRRPRHRSAGPSTTATATAAAASQRLPEVSAAPPRPAPRGRQSGLPGCNQLSRRVEGGGERAARHSRSASPVTCAPQRSHPPRRPYHFAACPALRRVGQERTKAAEGKG